MKNKLQDLTRVREKNNFRIWRAVPQRSMGRRWDGGYDFGLDELVEAAAWQCLDHFVSMFGLVFVLVPLPGCFFELIRMILDAKTTNQINSFFGSVKSQPCFSDTD